MKHLNKCLKKKILELRIMTGELGFSDWSYGMNKAIEIKKKKLHAGYSKINDYVDS